MLQNRPKKECHRRV